MTLDEARALDVADPLARFADRFDLPDGVIYLDGNSLGPLPKAVPAALADATTRQWGNRLIRSWNEGWIDAPQRLGGMIASLIGAEPDEVIVGDSTSTHLYKLIVAALRFDSTRTTIVSETGNFPTDLHIAQGAVQAVPGARLNAVPRAAIAEAIDRDTALVLLTHVHYKTAERFDMAALTARARDAGALILWDLSHSVGAVALDLDGAGADLAVGCTYKYLNGGPGAPAFVYVARRWQDRLDNPLSGLDGPCRTLRVRGQLSPRTGHEALARRHAPHPVARRARNRARPVGRHRSGRGRRQERAPVRHPRRRRRCARPRLRHPPRPRRARQPHQLPLPPRVRGHAGADRAAASSATSAIPTSCASA